MLTAYVLNSQDPSGHEGEALLGVFLSLGDAILDSRRRRQEKAAVGYAEYSDHVIYEVAVDSINDPKLKWSARCDRYRIGSNGEWIEAVEDGSDQ